MIWVFVQSAQWPPRSTHRDLATISQCEDSEALGFIEKRIRRFADQNCALEEMRGLSAVAVRLVTDR